MASEATSPSTPSSLRHTPPQVTVAAMRSPATATPVPPPSHRHTPPPVTTVATQSPAAATPVLPPTVIFQPSDTPVNNFTIFGNVNHDDECTVNFLKKRNYSIVIRDERELNIIRAEKVAKKHSEACTSRKRKEKVGEPNPNVSKAALTHSVVPSSVTTISTPHQLHSIIPLQRTPITLANVTSNMQAPPQLEVPFDLSPRNLSQEFLNTNLNQQILEHAPPSKAAVAQRLRRDRERNERPPVQPRFFPGLPRRRRRPQRMFLDQELNESNVIQNDHLSDELQNTCGNATVNVRSKHNLHRHYLANMNVACPYCKALHWMDEKLKNSSYGHPLFGTCCLQGKIQLPALLTPPPELASLYNGDDDKSKSFRRYTREYNAANAFTSLGVQMDDRVLSGRGPTSFTIHGELRHRTGTLLPQSGQEASYAQLYIYDPEAALDIRSRKNSHLRRDVLEDIQKQLLQYNAFSNKFRQAFAILEQLNSEDQNIPAYLHYSPSSTADRRRYNLPTANEVAVILPGDGSQVSGMRDIVVRLRGNNELMRINECHPAYLPLHYVLLFPYGELGWEPELKQWNVLDGRHTTNRLTQLQFYAYRLFERSSEYSTILRGGKLFQEFIVDAWAATEQNRLTYYKLNQPKLRRELYQGLTDIAANGFEPHQVGQQIVLPSSFRGSPRHMFEIFQDSMAITRYNQHPDIFLTMTANPNWHEITSALLPHQHATDRPDLVARVFELKRHALMMELDNKKVFGKKVGHVFTIEFQKRGLPHMHLLIFLEGQSKIRTCAQVDKIVSSEFPHPNEDPTLFETIKSCMVHGPCGTRNPHASCMENGKCTKRYPKQFSEETSMDQDGYPLYRRCNDGRVYSVRGHDVDNRDVVPYNPYLSRMFNCHINVEVCAGLRCVKYIHKYIYKGHDRTTMILGGVDEIQQYLDARYIGPAEAAWRIFGNPMHEELPNVVRLQLHLPGQHHVVYNQADSMHKIMDKANAEVSTLIGFFACCAANEDARAFTYQEFPQHYVWHIQEKKWTKRQRGFAIGRMYFASPNEGERFYLRLLLTVVKGPRSFECLKTVNNILHETFKSACVERGLLEDDEEWVQCLDEAATIKNGRQLRSLFSVILTHCSPLQPHVLWNKFSVHMCDDLACIISKDFAIPNPIESQITDYGLYLLNQLLNESGKSLTDFPPMPLPTGNWSTIVGNRLIWEHHQLQADAQQLDVQFDVDRLNDGQRDAYNAITSSVLKNDGTTFFLSGGAGTGKTFLYNTIATKCRSLGLIVITVASSGIASLLLIGGRTAHSTFCIPLDVLENSICGFTKQSLHAELFRKTKLIIWDEVPMQHRYCVEAVDRTLQDICDNEKPFGGITVVLGGDFRKILPVIQKGTREEIVGATLRRSVLWNQVHVLILNLNMRLNNTDTANADFSYFLTEIGSNPEENVELPHTIRKCRNLNDLLCAVYPELSVAGTVTPNFLNERTILSARNDDVSTINNVALNIFPGEMVTYFAADKILEDELVDETITNRYPNEFLKSLDPSGLPPFKLNLKVGCPIMLLRNIAPKDGLCNGTRLMVVKCAHRVIEAQILTGDKCGNFVFIPRISLTPSSSELPIKMTRRQFPVRLAYAMTMNKSQGQSVQFVGVDLRTPDWDAAARKLRYINSSSLRNWGSNEIVVHSPFLKVKYIHIDARIFFSVVKKIYTSSLKK